jgi:hypothetical protein
MKIKIADDSDLMQSFIADVNQACENLANKLTEDYDVEVFDTLSGDGFFTEVVEGAKAYCALAWEKVQSDARRTVLINTGEVPEELWTADADVVTSVGVSSELSALVAGLKKD